MIRKPSSHTPGRASPSRRLVFTLMLAPMLALTTQAFAASPPSSEEVRALSAEARAHYPEAFVDRDLWTAAIQAVWALVAYQPGDAEAQRLEAEILTETKWWILAWESWQRYREGGGDWDMRAQEQASLSARALAFYAVQRGDAEDAEVWRQRALQD